MQSNERMICLYTGMSSRHLRSSNTMAIQSVVQPGRMMFPVPRMIHGSVGDAARKRTSHSCTASAG